MWTELPFSLLMIQTPDRRPLSLGIAVLKGEHGIPVPTLSAAVLVSVAIPIVFYVAFQRFITLGSTAGALKE